MLQIFTAGRGKKFLFTSLKSNFVQQSMAPHNGKYLSRKLSQVTQLTVEPTYMATWSAPA